MILALDLGTTTGWAVSGARIISGVQSFKTTRYEGGGIRFLRFRKWVEELLDLQGPGLVVFEEVRQHAATDAAHVYGGLLAELTVACEQRSIAYQGTPVGTWKKAICGRGNAKKGDVIEEMRRRGHRPADDNEADALGVLYHALATEGDIFS